VFATVNVVLEGTEATVNDPLLAAVVVLAITTCAPTNKLWADAVVYVDTLLAKAIDDTLTVVVAEDAT
jgi:hypothetical protein